MAIRSRRLPMGLIHHSDRGVQGGFNRSSQLQALVQSFGGSSPSEGLAGPCIERVSNNCEYVRTVCAQIGSFREVLSKQSIGVLVRSALPRAVRFAEVDGKAGCDPQIRMLGHLCSLVPGQRAAKLRWQCRDRPGDGIANRFSPMTGKRRPVLHARDGAVAFHSGKMQQHCEPRGAFHQSADRRSAQADDQVTFPVVGNDRKFPICNDPKFLTLGLSLKAYRAVLLALPTQRDRCADVQMGDQDVVEALSEPGRLEGGAVEAVRGEPSDDPQLGRYRPTGPGSGRRCARVFAPSARWPTSWPPTRQSSTPVLRRSRSCRRSGFSMRSALRATRAATLA